MTIHAEAFTSCFLGEGSLGVKRVAAGLMFSFFFTEKTKVHLLGIITTTPSNMEFPTNRLPMHGEGKPESNACYRHGLQFYSNTSSQT